MQQVECVKLGDLRHARRQREIVRRMFEQRIVKKLHLVEMDIGLAAGEPERCGRGDEVDLVTTRGKLDAKLGGYDARATVRGVAGDTDTETAAMRFGGGLRIFGLRAVGSHRTFLLPVSAANRRQFHV
jgi:hypothetical protein